MPSLLGLNGVKARTVRSNCQALELLGKLIDGEVLLSNWVEMTQIPVDCVVLHDGDSGCGTKDELCTGSGLWVIAWVHARVSGGGLVLRGVDPVHSWHLLTCCFIGYMGTLVPCHISPWQVVRDGGYGTLVDGVFFTGVIVSPYLCIIHFVIFCYIR